MGLMSHSAREDPLTSAPPPHRVDTDGRPARLVRPRCTAV